MTNLTNEVEAHEAQEAADALQLAAIHYLQDRFYPPLPAEYAPVLIAAVAAVNEGDPGRELELPDVQPVPREAYTNSGGATLATASYLVGIFRVEHLIDDDETEEV